MAYSIDFIKRAASYKQEGHTLKQLREAFGIPAETYYDWKEKLENGFDFGAFISNFRLRHTLFYKQDFDFFRYAHIASITNVAIFIYKSIGLC